MTDDTTGHNTASPASLIEEARLYLRNQKALNKLQAVVKEHKQRLKDSGYNMKVFGKVMGELMKDAEHMAGQLQLELELDTYRTRLGLPTDLDAALEAVRSAIDSVEFEDPIDVSIERLTGLAESSGAGVKLKAAPAAKTRKPETVQ